MHVKIPMRPWKESWQVSPDEADIIVVTDRWHDDSPGLAVHVVEIGDVEILCHGFSMAVGPMDAFLTFTAHNIHEKSWDAYLEHHGSEDWLEGSGRVSWSGPDFKTQGATWWPGCDLVVPVTSVELSPLPIQRLEEASG